MIQYKWQEGLPFLKDSYGGISLPQVYCAPVMSCGKNRKVMFTDDVIFPEGKKGMFQVVVLLKSLADLRLTQESLLGIDKLSQNYVIADEATFIVQQWEVKENESGLGHSVFRLATADEFAATADLCKDRPVPLYYDMHRMEKDLLGMTFAIVRPDRFVYAACDAREKLHEICAGIRKNLGIA